MLNQPDLLHKFVEIIFRSTPSIGLIFKLFFLNMGISIFITFVLLKLVKLEITKRKWAFSFLLVSVGTFIPLLGNMVIIVVVLLLRKYGKDFHPIEINTYPQVEYSRKNALKTVAYGTSWADVRLQSPSYSNEEREQALHSVSRGLPRETNLIYSKLVSDDLEELRICAFSMLEIQQDYLQTKINQLLKKYNEVMERDKKAFIAKQIALLYWELVYRNLSEQEFRAILLARSYFFANIALEVLIDDTTLLILLSRISIENGNVAESLRNLAIASEYHAPNSKIIPYLAELAYKNKDYQAVRQYLSSDFSLRYVFKINKIVNFWCQ